MPGHRHITGADLAAQLRQFGPSDVDPDLFEAWVGEEQAFASLDELQAACPPERVGLTSGAYASLFGPLFGEFE
jgi:hypothetical protein